MQVELLLLSQLSLPHEVGDFTAAPCGVALEPPPVSLVPPSPNQDLSSLWEDPSDECEVMEAFDPDITLTQLLDVAALDRKKKKSPFWKQSGN